MSRRIGSIALAGMFAIAACSPGSASPSLSAASTNPAQVAPSVAPSAPPSPSVAVSATPSESALPVIARDEPLLLYYHCYDLCGTPEGLAGIYVMRPDGTDIRRIGGDAPGAAHKHPDWSPDGQRVVFIDQNSERMWIANLDGSPSTSVEACDTVGCDYPAWSPDGRSIAFSRYENDQGVGPAAVGIYVLDLASGDVRMVVRLERPLLADVPRWSPDGSQIVFGVDRMDDEGYETGAAIAIVPATGGEPRYLTEFEQFAYYPDWNRVTGEIVFSTEVKEYKKDLNYRDRTWNLYGVQSDGTALRVITDVPAGTRLWNPRWTPDGSRITAADFSTFTGLYVDPKTGALEPFPTTVQMARPQLRPLPKP